LRNEWVFLASGIPTTLETMLQQHLGREPPNIGQSPIATLEEEKKLPGKPGLDPDAEIERTIRLSSAAAPLQWIAGAKNPQHIYLSTSTELHAFSLANGQESKHRSTGTFTHAADLPDGFIAAGPDSVAIYGPGPAPIWQFRVPVAELLPVKPGENRMFTDDFALDLELSSFRLCGFWLTAKLGERFLIAFDLLNRRVAWVLSTNRKPGFHPSSFSEDPRFGSEFFMNSHFLAVQVSDGKRWIIRTQTGHILDVPEFGQDTTRAKWVLPPAGIANKYLAVPDGPALIRLLSLTTGRLKWTNSETQRTSSLSGEPAQIRYCGGNLLMAVRRNYGVELDCLNIEDGKSLWEDGPVFLDAERINLAYADSDNDRAYLTVGQSVVAIDLKKGKMAWKAKLPDLQGVAGWVVRAGRKCVIVYPLEAIPREDPGTFGKRLLRTLQSHPDVWRLPGLAFGLYDAWIARTFPLLTFDLEEGRSLGTIEIPARGPYVSVCFDRDRAVVATGDRICWLK
jgi:hypothetical protein